jgi:hypothetical protein
MEHPGVQREDVRRRGDGRPRAQATLTAGLLAAEDELPAEGGGRHRRPGPALVGAGALPLKTLLRAARYDLPRPGQPDARQQEALE